MSLPHPLASAACLALLALAACNEPAPQIRLNSPDQQFCKALLAENPGCNIVTEGRTAAVRAWLAAHPGSATAVREAAGGRLCLTEPFDRDTDAAFEGLKGVASNGSGPLRVCTDTGNSLEAQ